MISTENTTTNEFPGHIEEVPGGGIVLSNLTNSRHYANF